jgi:flagellar export protein FliJ
MMKKMKSRIESVLEHRRRLQDRAALELSAAERKTHEAGIRVAAVEDRLEALVCHSGVFASFSASELAQKAAYAVRLHEELSSACLAQKAAEQGVLRARTGLEKCRRERRLVETLIEKEREAFEKESIYKEQQVMDELSMHRGFAREAVGVL